MLPYTNLLNFLSRLKVIVTIVQKEKKALSSSSPHPFYHQPLMTLLQVFGFLQLGVNSIVIQPNTSKVTIFTSNKV